MGTKKAKDKVFEIMGGPGRDTLFDACKYAYDRYARIRVRFDVVAGYSMPKGDPGCAAILMNITGVRIMRIEHENGSGNSFNVYGYCQAELPMFDNELSSYKFVAYYNTRQRKGTIKFIEA